MKNKMLIAGPCSAESREQILELAKDLSTLAELSYFRAGIWKPRTKPGSFEGMGTEALPWLSEAKKLYGVKICTEVASAKHIEEALKGGMDMLWIGARTTVSPFAVQEIAEALKGVNLPIFIKNPINPDLNLWVGAYERIKKLCTGDIGLIHRGFSLDEDIKYRNSPMWKIPLEIRRLLPESKLICDPSHIAGSRAFISEISELALSFKFDGLMIETHNDPDKALSDAAQQVTFPSLEFLIENLKQELGDNHECNELEQLREKINMADLELIDALIRRHTIVKDIAQLKKDNDIQAFQGNRFEKLIKNRVMLSSSHNINEKLILKIFDAIHEESVDFQKKELKVA